MNRQIKLHDQQITYTLRISKRARSARLTVYRDGSLVVTAPTSFRLEAIEKFMVQKSKWILDKIEYFKKREKKRLDVLGKMPASEIPHFKNTKAEYKECKPEAQKLAESKVQQFNAFYNFNIGTIAIKNQKTRWGSCSRHGNLNFNYKIALLPQRLSDYIVVHEICHIGQFNHSRNFWNLVAQTIPDYMQRRKELRILSINLS
jgi:predicted metal-dependent hydrolase